jgi:hypothetical protein
VTYGLSQPPTELRLDQLKPSYLLRLISAPEYHPVRQRSPDDYPPYYETGRNQDENSYP